MIGRSLRFCVLALATALAVRGVHAACYVQALTASPPTGDAMFGSAIALDGNTLVVGARFAGAPDGGNGTATVYVREGYRWREQATVLAPPGSDPQSEFGAAVAVQGDTLVVGAHFQSRGTDTRCGSVFVFRRTGEAWNLEEQLWPPLANIGSEFGNALAIEGDRLVIGAYHGEPFRPSGFVYVFERAGGPWYQTAEIVASDPSDRATDWFGFAIALDGDRMIIGAPLRNGRRSPGKAYIFDWDGATWSETTAFEASDGVANDWFGLSVDLEATTAVVGALPGGGACCPVSGLDTAAAYTFVADPIWRQETRLVHPDPSMDAGFGASVDLHRGQLLVGCPVPDRSGSILLFERQAGAWEVVETLDQPLVDEYFAAPARMDDDWIIAGGWWDVAVRGYDEHVFAYLRSPPRLPDEVSAGSSPLPLLVTKQGSDITFSFEDLSPLAEDYHLLEGDLANCRTRSATSCSLSPALVGGRRVASIPPSPGGRHYIVAAWNGCGEGPIGGDSRGGARAPAVPACP